MLAVFLLGFISAAAANPQFNYHYSSYFPGFSTGVYYEPYNNYNIRDPWEPYWSRPYYSSSQAGIVDNKYQLTIPLDGFEDKDIVIKFQEGILIVDACHRVGGECEKTFFSSNAIPNYVDPGTGVWTYKQGILKVVFSLRADTKTPTSTTETVPAAEHPVYGYGQLPGEVVPQQSTYRNEQAPETTTLEPQTPDYRDQVQQTVVPVPQQPDNRDNDAEQSYDQNNYNTFTTEPSRYRGDASNTKNVKNVGGYDRT